MPGSRTAHLGGMVGNQHAVKVVLFQDCHDPCHVNLAFVDKGLGVVGDLPFHIPEVDVSDIPVAGITVAYFVDVPFGHFGQRAKTEFQRVMVTRDDIQQSLIQLGLIHQTRLLPNSGQGGIVGMCVKSNTLLLGDRHQLV